MGWSLTTAAIHPKASDLTLTRTILSGIKFPWIPFNKYWVHKSLKQYSNDGMFSVVNSPMSPFYRQTDQWFMRFSFSSLILKNLNLKKLQLDYS